MAKQKHTTEFESCVEQVVKQGHDKGSAFAICTETFKKAGKPIFVGESETQRLHLFNESFKLEGNKVSGVAIHPTRIFHPDEEMTHVYMREELKKAASTLVGKPFGIDHQQVLPPPNIVTDAWYCHEHDGVCFEGIVDDQVAKDIRRGAFNGLSIELNWLQPGGKVEFVNGVAPRNFELTGVHFLKHFPPGDPDAFVKLWEQVKEQIVVGPPLPLDQRVEALETKIQEVLNQINVINAKLEVLTGSAKPETPVSPPNEEHDTLDSRVKALEDWQKELRGHETQQVEEQKSKDEHDSDEYKEFMAQCMESGKSMEQCMAEWKQKQAQTAELQVGQAESIVALRKRLVEIEAQLAEIEKEKTQEVASWKGEYGKLREAVEGAIPPPRIWKSWTPGPQRYVQENLRILRKRESESQ